MSGRSQPIEITKIRADLRDSAKDRVAIEEPLEIRLGFETGGKRRTTSVSITMRTPGDDEELALGFLFSEGILHSFNDVALVKPCQEENTLRVELEPGVAVDLERLQRHFYTTSSCGVCGKASLEALSVQGRKPLPVQTGQFDRNVVIKIPDRLRAAQETFEDTGGLHAAAAFDTQGELLVVREDVGRHNAVDKVVGALLSSRRLPAADLGLMVSGRASFVLMQKALAAGMPLLAAVSAPSSLAVELAREFNVTLIGFLRGNNFNIYAGEERIA